MTPAQLLEKYGIKNRNGFFKQGKRSRVFDTQNLPYLSSNTVLVKVLENMEKAKQAGYSVKIEQYDYHHTPSREEIACEREWHESKGSQVLITFSQPGKNELLLECDVDNEDFMHGMDNKNCKELIDLLKS